MNRFCQFHGRLRLAFGEEVAHFFLLRNWYACLRTSNGRMGQFGFPVGFHAHPGTSLISLLEATNLTNLAADNNIGLIPHCELLWRTINDA
jgi:hypothetical protein